MANAKCSFDSKGGNQKRKSAFTACPTLAGLFERELDLPLARPRVLDREPVQGAVTLALRLLEAA